MTDDPSEILYLVGAAGHPNYGDDFIAAAWLKHLAVVRPDAEVWLDCHTPGNASHLFHALHPRVRFTDTLFRLVWETMELPRDEADRLIRRRVRELGTPRFDQGVLALRRASTVHFLGGGHLSDRWPFHVGLLQAAAALRDVTEVPGLTLAATGLGLTPAGDPDSLVEALSAFDHVSVRDAPSVELSGAQLAPDDSYLGIRELAGFGSDPQPVQDGDVWVCLQHDVVSEDAFESIMEATRAALTDPSMEGRTVHYLEALPGVDRVAFDRLSDLIPEENFVSFLELWHGGFPARAGQTWFTTRFHVGLFAAACGAAGTAMELDDDYYRVKHASLVDLGTGWSVTPSGSRTAAEPSVSRGFPYASRLIAQDKLREARKLYPPAPAPVPTQPVDVPQADKRKGGWRSR